MGHPEPRPSKPRRNLFTFTLRGMEEMSQFPSPQVGGRDEALRDLNRSIRWWEDLLAIIGITAIVVAARYGLLELSKWLFPNPNPDLRIILQACRIVLLIAIALLALRALHRWGVRDDLRQRLINAGVPICLHCGYGLQGLPSTTSKCPECGAALDERIRAILAQPPSHA